MIITDKTVAIMMATYNGERYVGEQIESILAQTYKDWVLFIKDDGSLDETVEIIRYYEKMYPRKIKFINESELSSGNAKNNFAGLHMYVTRMQKFSYFMFCDQDDVWIENKVEKSLKFLQRKEMESSLPILIHTDLFVVDEKLNVICDSYVKYRSINYKITDINHLLIQNNVTGCTMLWNKKLNDIIGDMSSEKIIMHDWWIAIVASLFGEIFFIYEPLIKYRQHNNNVVGATNVNSLKFIMMRMKNLNHVKTTLRLPIEQAELIKDRYKGHMRSDIVDIVEKFISLEKKNKFSKIFILFKYSFWKQGIVQIIGEMMFI